MQALSNLFTAFLAFPLEMCSVQAYIGPGAGLSAIGALLALLAAILLAFLGFLWYPMKRMLRKRRQKVNAQNVTGRRPREP